MTEAASQINLEMLDQDPKDHILIPRSKQGSIFKNKIKLITSIFVVISVISLFIRWVLQNFQNIYTPVIMVLIPLMFIRRYQVKGIYKLEDQELIVPYMWFLRKTIPLENIVRVADDTIKMEENEESFAAIRIMLDTELIKYNITGLQPPNILLTTQDYNSHELDRFADKIVKEKRDINEVPNSLAQRLTDQVNRAWENRWNNIILNIFDASSEALLPILIIEAFFYGILNFRILTNLGVIFIGIFIIFAFIGQLSNKPQAIVGIRPHELGPLVYDEEELITSVRFIVMCRPYTVHLLGCEVEYDETGVKQPSRMKQIQPEYVEPGELVYGVAQMMGNHTKAIGATIKFTYKEKEENDQDITYEVPIDWS